MVKYASLFKQRLGIFATWKLEHIQRDSNKKVEALVVMAASILIRETMFLPIYYHPTLSITTDQMSQIYEESPSWLTLIMRYLSLGG